MKLQLLPALLLVVFCVSCSSAQSVPAVPASRNSVVRTTPVQVGEKAPEFVLEDQQGNSTALVSVYGKKTTILVFYRGSW